MAKDKKKQHYVPQCYLESWAIPDSYQVYVYDKAKKKPRTNNIEDVAEERYFYDIDLSGVLSEEEIRRLGLEGQDLSRLDDDQYIENLFSNDIENGFKFYLDKLREAHERTEWEWKNCFFFSEVDKFRFSFFLAAQYIRVKSVRTSIADSSDCLTQWLTDMGASTETLQKYTTDKKQLSYIHGKMICNNEEIQKLSRSFFSLTWILRINTTDNVFFTSDNPIGTIPHIKHPFMAMSGLNSRGVEVYFPIAPDLILVMYDGEYHKEVQPFDRRMIEMDAVSDVTYYNKWITLESERCVFSADSNFSVMEELLNKDETVFDKPKSVLHWGDKTYSPRKNKKQ